MSADFFRAVRIPPVASFPAAPREGDAVVLASDGHLYHYDGTVWVDDSAGGGGGGGLTEYQVRQRIDLIGGPW